MFDVAASYTTNQCHDWMAARRNAVISLKNGTALRCLFYSTVKFIGLLLPLLVKILTRKNYQVLRLVSYVLFSWGLPPLLFLALSHWAGGTQHFCNGNELNFDLRIFAKNSCIVHWQTILFNDAFAGCDVVILNAWKLFY